MCRTRDHDQHTVEALLQDEAGTRNVWPKRDDDDRPPPVLVRQTTQFSCFAFGGNRIWNKTQQLWVWGGAEVGHSRVIGPVRHHDSRCPSLGLKIQAHGVAVLAVSAQDEDRVGTVQVIDLRSHVNRERGDDGRGQQHASAYCYSSEAPQAPGSHRRRCSAGLEFVTSAYGIGAPGVGCGERHDN